MQIKADIETKGEFINGLIEKVMSVTYTDIEDVLKFVDSLDEELSSLVIFLVVYHLLVVFKYRTWEAIYTHSRNKESMLWYTIETSRFYKSKLQFSFTLLIILYIFLLNFKYPTLVGNDKCKKGLLALLPTTYIFGKINLSTTFNNTLIHLTYFEQVLL